MPAGVAPSGSEAGDAATCARRTGRLSESEHLRHLRPAPDHRQGQPGRRLGRSEQRRDRLHAHEFVLANRVEAQFTAPRYFALDGTDHATHKEQASMIRRYIIWRNNHAYDERLRQVVTRANVA